MRYGLIGRSLGHSFSKTYFTEKFAREGLPHQYDLFELSDVAQLRTLIADTPDLRGLNVTIPYKEAVLPLLDELDPLAAAVGAVNTIRITATGRLIGHNTDVFGFRSLVGPVAGTLREPGSDIRPRALVLGSGGASRAVAFVLRDLGIRFRVVSRDRTKGDLTWDMVDRTVISVCKLVVNTTPLGMHPADHEAPDLPYAALTPKHVLIDLVYNPERTLFLERGMAQGARAIGGLGMLHAQAEEAWRIWSGAPEA